MSRFNNVLEAVGATPLIRLNHIGSEFGSEIFVKFEAANPGGSIKDRIGEDYFPVTYDKGIVDQFFRISDGESFRTARRLVREEGIFAGGSSETALAKRQMRGFGGGTDKTRNP